ncbi:hypothetical protein VEJY3_22891 [Vibrio sp. EJY3]|nr:hypothetical protein VEJY3_22891 [Vibrio sp. EJY3]AXT73021.1 hypothetical protein DBX26_18885 [Vibrio sp. dhg]AXT74217.1 hypothetical protein DBX26_24925 [Vibrio sp. dhg]
MQLTIKIGLYVGKLPKPTQKQKQLGLNPKGKRIKRIPEELKRKDVHKRIEYIEEQKTWDKEWGL